MIRTPAKQARATKRIKLTTKNAVARRSSLFVPRSVGRATTGFQKQLRMKHKYVETNGILVAASVTPVVLQYSVNGMFLPITGGHQPMYFDQVGAIYNRYTVLSSRIKVEFVTPNSNGEWLGIVYIEDDTTITPSNMNGVMEQASASFRSNTEGNGPLILFKNWNAKEFTGGDARPNEEISGTPLANPALQQYFTLSAALLPVGTGTVTVRVLVTVEYDVLWDDLKNITNS